MTKIANRVAKAASSLEDALETAAQISFAHAQQHGTPAAEAISTARAFRAVVAKAYSEKPPKANPHSTRDDPGDNYDMSVDEPDEDLEGDEGDDSNPDDPSIVNKGFAPRGEAAGSASSGEHAWATSSSSAPKLGRPGSAPRSAAPPRAAMPKMPAPPLGRPGSTQFAKSEDASSLYDLALELSE